ncbi:Uncharacterised protein [Haploplasma axanthum]|uniref:Uncharacterized protein n=2 Tax=Haploplasma axanthum TaxID=29552 RepID=A0A449BEC5_HAPAX|nr:Uncharacterised protein [Haploplasma axanthum]
MVIAMFIIVPAVFFLLRSQIAKEKTYRGRMIFSVIYASIIVIFLLVMMFNEENKINNRDYIITIIYTIFFITAFNIFDYYKNKETLNITNKGIRLKRFTVLKGYRVISLSVLMLNIIILLLNLFINDFKRINELTISLIIILVIVTIWNIIIMIDLKKSGFKKETVIIFNNNTYIEYDVTKKWVLNLRKYLKNINAINSFRFHIIENEKVRISWVYYVKNDLDKQKEINKYLFNLLLNNEDKVVTVNLDIFQGIWYLKTLNLYNFIRLW